jgi:predicted phage terminase large subunit-like protein
LTQLETLAARAAASPDRALLALDRVECEESLLHFLRGAWRWITPQQFVYGWHLEAIAEHLEAVTRGEILRLVINIPPRMTKSSLVSVAWPAWVWAQRPELVGAGHRPLAGPKVQFLTTSYGAALSTRDSLRTRRLIQTGWYQSRWGGRFELTGDQNAKQRYENDKGGYRLATSVGGTLTGEGGDVIIVDDPHNTIEIESEAMREEAIMWWDEALSTRLNNIVTGAYVIIMQRLYENDLTGHVLSQDMGDWTHLMLPMEYDSRRHCTTSVAWRNPFTDEEETFSDPRVDDGELLCPERVPARELERLKGRLGPFGVAGQLQQSPVPRGGAIINADWWMAWPPEVEYVETKKNDSGRAVVTYPEMEYVIASLDTAMTEEEENDFSAMTVWGLWYDKHDLPNLMLMEAWNERLPMHSLVVKTIKVCERRQVDMLLIEAKNNGFSAAQEIARLTRGRNWGVVLEPTGKKNKAARAHACVPTFAASQVWAPAQNTGGNIVFFRWAQAVIDQCALVPRGEHDDLADTATQAINYFRRNSLLLTKEDRREELHRQQLPPAERDRRLVNGPLYGVM